jgi:hypothetical protein
MKGNIVVFRLLGNEYDELIRNRDLSQSIL